VKGDVDSKVERTLESRKDTFRRLAEVDSIAEAAIGKTVLTLLADRDEISVADLVAHFKEQVELLDDQNLMRWRAEGALRRLCGLRGP
jgi:hypothetical protein